MNKQEKLTPENIDLLEKMMRDGHLLMLLLIVVAVAFNVFQYYMQFANNTTTIIVSVLCVGFAYFLTVTNQKALKQDIKNGFKSIINGTITHKTSTKGGYNLYIDKISYVINYQQFMDFNVGDDIQIEISPIRKHVFKITKNE